MDGWRGLVVLSFGLVIGVLLWLGVASLVEPPQLAPRMVQAAPPPAEIVAPTAEGVSGAIQPAAAEAPPKPFIMVEGAAPLTSLLEGAPFVHRGATGPALYVVVFRSCPNCAVFKDAEWDRLESAGVDLRWVVYARRDKDGAERSLAGERALVAELALTRNYPLLVSWLKAATPEEFYQRAQLPQAAESSAERMGALEKTRALVDSLNAVTVANGQEMAIPAFFWRQDDGWHALIGYDPAAFASVKQALLQARVEAAPEAPVAHP